MKNTRNLSDVEVSEIVLNALEQNAVKYERSEDKTIFLMKYKINDMVCDVSIICSSIFYVITVDYPNIISESKFHDALELINLRNVKIPFGSFEINPQEKQISFRYGALVSEKNLPTESAIFENLRYCLSASHGESDLLKSLI